jgi:hypothetical protein
MVAAALLIVAGVAMLTRAAGDVRKVGDELDGAHDALNAAATLVREGRLAEARAALDVANGRVLTANNTLHASRELTVLGAVPGFRQNLFSLRASVATAYQLSDGGRSILEEAAGLEDSSGKVAVPVRGGVVPVRQVARVREQIRSVGNRLPAAGEEPSRWLLLPPVARLQRQVYDEAALRQRQLADLTAALTLAEELTGGAGPRRFLLAVSNAAEMRGTGGMILSYGVVTAVDGKLTLERVGPIDELLLTTPVSVALPHDFEARVASLGPTINWRNANLAGDFRIVAPALEAMYQAATGTPVDGVMQVDSAALAAMLQGVGPVEVEALGTVTADNAVALTLNQAYVAFPNRPVRQEHLSTVAEAAFRRVVDGQYESLTPLARALAEAAQGRHIQVHLTRPEPQRAVVRLAVDGSLPDGGVDFVSLAVQNFSGNKLDYYLDTGLRVSGRRRRGEISRVQVTVDVTNTAPPGGRPPYVFGPFDRTLSAGEYRGSVEVRLPAGASLVTATGGPFLSPAFAAGEGGVTLIGAAVDLRAGEHKQLVFDIDLPPRTPGRYHLLLVPTPRVRPTTAVVDLDVGGRRLRVESTLDRVVDAE